MIVYLHIMGVQRILGFLRLLLDKSVGVSADPKKFEFLRLQVLHRRHISW